MPGHETHNQYSLKNGTKGVTDIGEVISVVSPGVPYNEAQVRVMMMPGMGNGDCQDQWLVNRPRRELERGSRRDRHLKG